MFAALHRSERHRARRLDRALDIGVRDLFSLIATMR